MSGFDTTASRFLRPTDVARLRRNQRRIQLQRLVVGARGGAVLLILAVGLFWAWRSTQSDTRFAVQTIEVDGAVHTSRKELDRVTGRYKGLNLFQIDIARVQGDLGGLPWVDRIDIEKKLPDTLRIKISERQPVALLQRNGGLYYTDQTGLVFAELSPAAGNDDLPLISGGLTQPEIARTVTMLRALRTRDPQVYSRVSEARPVAPRGFALFDRELKAFVYVDEGDLSAKYRSLYSVMEAENRPHIEYADLRFDNRIVIKPAAQRKEQTPVEALVGLPGVSNSQIPILNSATPPTPSPDVL